MDWRSDAFDLSVDGRSPVESHLVQNVAPGPSVKKPADERLTVSSRIKTSDAFILSELILFSVPLTPEEIQSLYETSRRK
jgi:hypothetical protein